MHCVEIGKFLRACSIDSEHAAAASAGNISGREKLLYGLRRGKHVTCNSVCKTLPGRLELLTLRLTASRSNQLSYGSHVDTSSDLNARVCSNYTFESPRELERNLALNSRSLI